MESFALTLAAAAKIISGQFEYQETRDPMTDSAQASAIAVVKGGSIVVKCDKVGAMSVQALILSPEYLASPGGRYNYRDFQYRIGTGAAKTEKSFYQERFVWMSNHTHHVILFLKELMDGNTALFRFTRIDGTTLDMKVDYSNAKKAISQTLRFCDPVNYGTLEIQK